MPHECSDEIRPVCKTKLDTMHDDIKCIKKALMGNGDTDKGLIGKVAGNSKTNKILILIVMALLAVALAGCIPSSAATISARLTDVQQAVAAARTSVQDARTATEQAIKVIPADSEAQAPLRAATGHLKAAEGHMGRIAKAATEAQKELPNVEDKATWFDKLTGAVLWVAGAVVAVVLLLAGWWIARRVGWLIPRKTKREAQLARKVLDAGDEATVQEMIAAKRGADPGFDKAFTKTSPRPPPVAA